MTARLNILFLPKWYPCKNQKLNGIFVRRHAEAVAEYANIFVLYAIVDPGLASGLFYSELSQGNNITTLIYYYRKRITGISFIDKFIKLFLYFLCSLLGYRRLKKSYCKPDLIHVHVLLRTGVLAWLLKIIESIPLLYTEHWSGYHPEDGSYKGFFIKLITKHFFNNVEVIMPVTEHLATAMKRHGIEGHFEIISNVVNTDLFVPEKGREKSVRKIALHVSNFDARAKNVSGILDVLAEVKKNRNDFELWIVGNGNEKEDLIKKAKGLHLLQENVFFLGEKHGVELVHCIQQTDFLFMFSNYENQPCIIMEALACGKPVLATKVGGIPNMIDSSRGLLGEPDKIQEMAKKFSIMIDTSISYKESELRTFAVAHYSYINVGKQIVAIYQTVLHSVKKSI